MYPQLTRMSFYRKYTVATKNIYVKIFSNTILNCDIKTGCSFKWNVLMDKYVHKWKDKNSLGQWNIDDMKYKKYTSACAGAKKYNENILVFFCTAPDNIRPRVGRCSSLTRLGSCSALWVRGRSIRIFQVFLVVKMLLGNDLDCWAG